MRVVLVGGGSLASHLAALLTGRDHDVVIVEKEKAVVDVLADRLDCGFVLGDGTRPAILKETSPKEVDLLFALTDDDATNLLAGLVGRSLGVARVVARLEEEEYEHIALELGLRDAIIPSRAIARFLADMADGQDILELSTAVKGEARIFQFVARDKDAGPAAQLELPDGTRASHLFRDGEFALIDPETELRSGDEVVLLTTRSRVQELRERFGPGADRGD